MPKVSVIIPNYNHERFLERRINSVLNQTYQDFEIILLDDASTDNSIEIIDKFKSNPRFRIHVNKVNSRSPFIQWNLGVQMATGEYIWIAESDDDSEPQFLSTLVNMLDRHPSAVIAYCQSYATDSDGRRLYSKLHWTNDLDTCKWKSNYFNIGRDELVNCLAVKNTIPNASAVVFKKSAFLSMGGAPTDKTLSGDWRTWIGLLIKGDVVYSSEHLNFHREHSNTVRSRISVKEEMQETLSATRMAIKNIRMSSREKSDIAEKTVRYWSCHYVQNFSFFYIDIYYRLIKHLYKLNYISAFRLLVWCCFTQPISRIILLIRN